MKVVDVCEFYASEGGGVRTYIHAKLAIGERLGHEIVIIAPSDHNETIHHGNSRIILVKAPALPFDRRYGMFWDAEPIHQILDVEQPDVLEASSPWRGAWIAARWQGQVVRSLFMHHDPLSAFAYRWFGGIASREQVDQSFAWFWRYLRRMAAGFELVVCAAPSLTDRLAAGGINGALTLPMGVDQGVFSPALRDPAIRSSLLARCSLDDDDATLLLGIGRHTPEKRWPCVMDAVACVAARRPLGFVLIGSGHDQARVLAHIDGNPHIQALEPIRDRALLARVIASADALIHGSAAETFGLVAAEAIASGLPLIVPAGGAVADLADPTFSELYTPGDARACADAIDRLLDRDPVHLRAHTCAAAARARTLDDHFIDLFALYERRTLAIRKAA